MGESGAGSADKCARMCRAGAGTGMGETYVIFDMHMSAGLSRMSTAAGEPLPVPFSMPPSSRPAVARFGLLADNRRTASKGEGPPSTLRRLLLRRRCTLVVVVRGLTGEVAEGRVAAGSRRCVAGLPAHSVRPPCLLWASCICLSPSPSSPDSAARSSADRVTRACCCGCRWYDARVLPTEWRSLLRRRPPIGEEGARPIPSDACAAKFNFGLDVF